MKKSAASSRHAQHYLQQLSQGQATSPSFASFALLSPSFLHIAESVTQPTDSTTTPAAEEDNRTPPSLSSATSGSGPFSAVPASLFGGGHSAGSEVECPEPSVALLLKRLSKRDAVTKLKALDALTGVLSSLPLPSLLSVLPSYFAAYARVWKDNDRRVREGLYPSLLLVMRSATRATTPWLRSIFPLWWSHCHDVDREVSRAAWKALRGVWGEEDRQRQVLHYVHVDYFQHTHACLTSTVQSLSDMAVTSMEEAQERFDRVVAAALLGLASFIDSIHDSGGGQQQSSATAAPTSTTSTSSSLSIATPARPPSPSPYSAELSRLLDAAVRHLSSPRPLLRRSLYSLLTRAVRLHPSYFTERLPSLSILLFAIVAEADGACQASMWDLLLSFLRAFPSSLSHLPPGPQRYRVLIRTIEQGSYGHPTSLYSHLLPLLASLPPSSTSASFFASFFRALHASAGVKEERSGSVSAAGDEVSMATAYIECALYTVVSARRDRPSISLAVLYDELLPFVQRVACSSTEAAEAAGQRGEAELCTQAGRALAIIERHVAAGDAQQPIQREDDSERRAAESFFSLSTFHFRWQELCVTALEAAEREERAQQLNGREAASDDGPGTSKARVRPQLSGWAKVEQLLRSMNEERNSARKPPLPAQDDGEKSGEESAPSLLAMAWTVLHHSLSAFTRSQSQSQSLPSLPPLRLALYLARTFSLNALLSQAPTPIHPTTFLSHTLLPLFHSVLHPSPAARAAPSAQSLVVEATIDLLALGLSAAGMMGEHASEEQRRVVDELLTACLSSSSSTSPLTAAALSALQSLLSRLASSTAHLRSHPLLEEEALHLAEALLTSPSPSLHLPLIALLTTLLPLLPPVTCHAILSSFADALSSFLSLSGLFAPSSVSDAQLREDSGATTTSLPALLDILASFIANPHLPPTAEQPSASPSPPSPAKTPLVDSLLSIVFFLQSSSVPALSSRAISCWQSLPSSVWLMAPSALCGIAERFHSALLSTALTSLTSEWILSWAHSAHSLLLLHPSIVIPSPSFPSARQLRQQLLDQLLVREGEVQALMADEFDAGQEERLRVLRDCYYELMSSEAEWGSEVLVERPQLLLDLLAIHHRLRRRSTHSAHSRAAASEDSQGEDVDQQLQLQLTTLIIHLASPSISSLLTLSIRVSSARGGAWSEALQQLLRLSSQVPTLPPCWSAATLFVRWVLLPLAQLAHSTSLPSSFSSLLSPLTSSLQETMTRTMQETLTAFTSTPDTFLPLPSGGRAAVSSDDHREQQQPLSPPLDVLLRALFAEAERVVTTTAAEQSGQRKADERALPYLSSLLCCLSSLLIHAPACPGWSVERCRGLLRGLPLPPGPQSEAATAAAAFHEGRAHLVLAVWSSLNRQQQQQLTPSFSPLIRLLLVYATSTLTSAVALSEVQSHSGVVHSRRSFSPSMVQPILLFLHDALPSLLSPSALIEPEALRPLANSAYQLLTSPAVALLSVTQHEEELTHLAEAVARVAHGQHSDSTATLLTLLAEDMDGASDSTSTFSSSSASVSPLWASPVSVSAPFFPSSRLSRLFALLAHPFPSVSLCAHSVLSLALLRRVSRSGATVEMGEESLAALQRQLSVEEGEDGDVSEAGDEEGGGRREARRRRRRAQREREKVREQVGLLLPPQLQALLEAKLATADDLPSFAPDASAAQPTLLFADRPIALQLRGYLLAFSLILSLLHQPALISDGVQQQQQQSDPPSPSTASPSTALSDAQRGVLIAYLRDEDIVRPYLDELSEHLLLSLSRDSVEVERQSQTLLLRGVRLSEMELLPVEAREQAEAQVTAAAGTRRMAQLARLRSALSYVDEAVWFPSLSAQLYLLALHRLPALARSWWSNCERQWSPLIAQLTASHFSPSLIRYELQQLAQQPPLTASQASASTLTISTSLSASVASARYRSGEVEMTLLLRLAPSHPLLPVAVEWTESVRVQAAWLMRWQVAIASALLSANGGLHSAIHHFFLNVEQHFAGASECPICYNVLHPVHHTLPRMTCRTCHHKFHSTCLYTWFEKSGHSTCPLCRATF